MVVIPLPEIFQAKPLFSKPSQFKAKSWTETIEGYQYEAKKLTTCILNNRKLLGRPYSWFVTIYIWDVMPPNEAAKLWTKVCRNLRRLGIIALWVREPTKKNKVHYHLLVSSQQTEKDLLATIEAAMPPRSEVGWHKNIKAVDNRWWLPFYITKAKIKGKFKGKTVPDKYASKRLLFQSKTQLRKHGTIGKFWIKSIAQLWKEVQLVEQRIANGLQDQRVKELAKYVYDLVQGYVPLKQIERNYGYHADSSVVQDWISSLKIT